jgi:hypothetical protein
LRVDHPFRPLWGFYKQATHTGAYPKKRAAPTGGLAGSDDIADSRLLRPRGYSGRREEAAGSTRYWSGRPPRTREQG